jgi:hypothetical protein
VATPLSPVVCGAVHSLVAVTAQPGHGQRGLPGPIKKRSAKPPVFLTQPAEETSRRRWRGRPPRGAREKKEERGGGERGGALISGEGGAPRPLKPF